MSRAAALAGLAQGLEIALDSVRKLMSSADPDEWVSQKTSPLGRRRHCELARAGTFPSARKVDGMWQVKRAEIDEYIDRHPTPQTKAAKESAEESELVARAMAYQPKRRRTA